MPANNSLERTGYAAAEARSVSRCGLQEQHLKDRVTAAQLAAVILPDPLQSGWRGKAKTLDRRPEGIGETI